MDVPKESKSIMTVKIPYFDMLFDALERGKEGLSAAFGHHVHVGYWGPGERPDGSMTDFAAAAERLTRRMCEIAAVRDGDKVLDVGCGLGGTLASLNERFSGVSLTGLNIDPRQIDWARERVLSRPGNRVEFHIGDACRMPFPDASFDVLLAVECIFHFSSRERFFSEARRVLRPGGHLCISDFVPRWYMIPSLTFAKHFMSRYLESTIGPVDNRCTLERYRELARSAGLAVVHEEDITRNTLPTYAVMRKLIPETGVHSALAHSCIASMELGSRLKAMRYMLLAFDAPDAAGG